MIVYEAGKKDEVTFQDSGKTLQSLRSIVNDSMVFYFLFL